MRERPNSRDKGLSSTHRKRTVNSKGKFKLSGREFVFLGLSFFAKNSKKSILASSEAGKVFELHISYFGLVHFYSSSRFSNCGVSPMWEYEMWNSKHFPTSDEAKPCFFEFLGENGL